jgi:hypothetical protein
MSTTTHVEIRSRKVVIDSFWVFKPSPRRSARENAPVAVVASQFRRETTERDRDHR